MIAKKVILHQMGDIRFQPNKRPHRIQGNTSTGLQAAKDSTLA